MSGWGGLYCMWVWGSGLRGCDWGCGQFYGCNYVGVNGDSHACVFDVCMLSFVAIFYVRLFIFFIEF